MKRIFNTKSIIAISLIITLNIAIIKGVELNKDIFLLFSNIITMTITYFFTRKKDKNE